MSGELGCCAFFDSDSKTVEEIAQILGIGRATCYRYIDYAAGAGWEGLQNENSNDVSTTSMEA